MKTSKPHNPAPIMKYLTPLEQKVHAMKKRHRAEYRRCMKRLHSIGKKARHTLLIAACASGLVYAITTPLHAAEAPAVSAPALFNEGNAAQRAGRLGPAILDYERARILAPGDEAIAQNLRVAREKAGVATPAVPVWQRPAYWLSFNALAGLASISLLLFCLLFFGTCAIPMTLRGHTRAASAILGATMLFAAGAVALRWPELDRAVIVAASPSAARIAPAANAAESFEVKPGEIVRAEDRYGAFFRIRTADGKAGWVSASAVERIIPKVS